MTQAADTLNFTPLLRADGSKVTNLYGTNINISFGSAGVTNGDGSITVTAGSGSGSVTSVQVTGPAGFTSSGGPITTSGTIALTTPSLVVTQNFNQVLVISNSLKVDAAHSLSLSNFAAGRPVILNSDNTLTQMLVGANLTLSGTTIAFDPTVELDLTASTNYTAGNQRIDGGLSTVTNLTAAANFNKSWSMTNVGAAYTQAAPIGVDTALKTFQQTLYTVTNTTGTAFLITLPSGLKKASWWGTNVTGFYVTNATIQWWTCRQGETNVYIETGY